MPPVIARAGSFVVLVAALVSLGGCASDGFMGLTTGPLPEKKAFVVESRTQDTGQYPAVGVDGAVRSDVVLTEAERKALEDELRRKQLGAGAK